MHVQLVPLHWTITWTCIKANNSVHTGWLGFMFLKNPGSVRALVRTIFLLISSGTFSNLIVTNLRLTEFKKHCDFSRYLLVWGYGQTIFGFIRFLTCCGGFTGMNCHQIQGHSLKFAHCLHAENTTLRKRATFAKYFPPLSRLGIKGGKESFLHGAVFNQMALRKDLNWRY